MELVVDVCQGMAKPLVVVTGDLDIASAPLLAAVLEHVLGGQIHSIGVDVDLSGVSFADSHGLAPVFDSGVTISATSGSVNRVLGLLAAPATASRAPVQMLAANG